LDVYEKSYLVQKIASVIEEVKPDTLILPYLYDVHSAKRYYALDFCISTKCLLRLKSHHLHEAKLPIFS
jgi:hypothetical protein